MALFFTALQLEMIFSDPRGLIEFGMSLYLLEVAILTELEVDLMLGAFFYIEGLVEIALGVIVTCMLRDLHGAGRSLMFLRC